MDRLFEKLNDAKFGDSPARNDLYKLLYESYVEMKNRGSNGEGFRWWYPITSWQSFCKLAVQTYDRKKTEARGKA